MKPKQLIMVNSIAIHRHILFVAMHLDMVEFTAINGCILFVAKEYFVI